MFTGIIEEVGQVISITRNKLTVAAEKVLKGTVVGDSISVNGVCLTVTDMTPAFFTVDLMEETRRRTNFSYLSAGNGVNLERAMQLGGRMGGHLVQGHIDDTGRVVSLSKESDAVLVKIETPPSVIRYVVEKGFIAVNGASLTVTNRTMSTFTVSIVEYTRKNTILSYVQIGDIVNLEVDIIAKYVEQLVGTMPSGITPNFLREHGFE